MKQEDSNAFLDDLVTKLDSGEDPLAAGTEEAIPELNTEAEAPVPKKSPGATFLQKGLNKYSQVVSGGKGPQVAVDGDFGPRTMKAAQAAIQGLPPEMKRWAVKKLKQIMDEERAAKQGG